MTIEELEIRIALGGNDAAECVHAAERLIRKEFARNKDINTDADEIATAAFILWRENEVAISTMPDGSLGLYKRTETEMAEFLRQYQIQGLAVPRENERQKMQEMILSEKTDRLD